MLREQLRVNKDQLKKLVSAQGDQAQQSNRQSDQLNKLADQKKEDAKKIEELRKRKAELASLGAQAKAALVVA